MKMIVWTVGGGARWGMLRLGGDHTNISAEVEVTGPYSIGKGFSAYIAKSPVDGSTHIVEPQSGALIGSTLAQVMDDVKCGTVRGMKAQVKAAILESKHTERITTEDFWGHPFK